MRRIRASGDTLTYVVFAIAVAALWLVPVFTTTTISSGNVYNVLQTFADYGLLALAVGLTMIVAEYDLSTASMYSLAGMVAVLLGVDSPVLGVVAALAVGATSGVIQGLIIAKLRMSSVPVTLGGFIVNLGITYVIAHNKDVPYDNITVGLRLDEPIATIFSIRSLITVGVFLIVAFLFVSTRVGPEVRGTGGDRRAARTSGVRVDRVLLAVFVFAGVASAAAGSLHAYSLSSAQPDLGFAPLIFATIAALLGGVNLAGGRGSPLGIAAGALSLAILQEILAATAAPQYWSDLITGTLLLLVTIFAAPRIYSWRQRRRVAVEVSG